MLRFHTFQVLVLVAVLSLTACTTGIHIQPEDRRAQGFTRTPEFERVAAQRNARLQNQYRDEWQFNRKPDGPPQLCVAMSGGGMRSASYNIGVLQGLHRLGLLSTVDILSSVSGGGYALSWYYLQQYYSKHFGLTVGPDDLFENSGRFQNYLSSHGNLLYRTTTGVYEIGRDTLSWLITLPANVVANGLFDWRINLNPWRHDYENNIERVFHLVPDPVYGQPLNRAWFWSTSTVEPNAEAELPQLRPFLLERQLPYFIINTTAAIDDDGWRYNSELSKSVYEFTPLHHGSDAFGYRQDSFPVNMSRAVSISGAAYDSTSLPGARRQVAASLVNGDLGYHIENPQANTPWWLYVTPFPLYVLPHNVRDIHGPSIYLTDGGHSENLAAYSVVRRLCRQIVIVDAEHDPNYQFEGLRRLQRRLQAEMGVELQLPMAEPHDQSCPVLKGQIGDFPLANGSGPVEQLRLGVTYIKLAMDPDRLNQYPKSVQEYYRKHRVPKKNLFGTATEDPFPQQPTSDQKFSEGQFQAYRDLGYYNTVTHYRAPGCARQRADAAPR